MKISLFEQYENICTFTLREDSVLDPAAVFNSAELVEIEDQCLILMVIISMAIVFNISILSYTLETTCAESPHVTAAVFISFGFVPFTGLTGACWVWSGVNKIGCGRYTFT